MTGPDATTPVLYTEPGSTWWPVLWGPIFAAVLAGLEATTGPVHTVAWIVVGTVLAAGAAVWVRARRAMCSVRLTATTLTQGREELSVTRITQVVETGVEMGARVLGGGLTVPRKFVGVSLRLDDDSTVLAWAKDGDALSAELRKLVES